MKRLLPIIITILLIINVTAIHSYNLKNVTAKDGLSNSSILSFGQMANGVMLFGTCDGVNCFDGRRVYQLPLSKNSYLQGSVIEYIVIDKKERCWVWTNHGLVMVNSNYEQKSYPYLRNTTRIRLNADNDLIVLQGDSLYYVASNDTTFHSTVLQEDDRNHVYDFVMTRQYLYLFSLNGIIRYSHTKKGDKLILSKRIVVSERSFQTASHDDETEYLIDTNGTLWSYNLETSAFQHLASLKDEIHKYGNIGTIKKFKDKLFVGFTTSGVLILQKEGNHYSKHNLNIQVGVISLYKDQSGDIMWIGTDGQGVLMYCDEPDIRRSLTYDVLQLRKPIRALLVDNKGSLWVATKGEGLLEIPHFDLNSIHDRKRHWYQESNSLSGNNVFALLQSHHLDGFWIATDKGLDFRPNEGNEIVSVKTGIPIEWISALCERGDTLWLTTQGMGVYRGIITGTSKEPHLEQMKHYVLENGQKTSNHFFSITNATEGPLFLGNRGKGLYMMQHDRLVHISPEIGTDTPVGLSDIYAILSTKQGTWVGTGCGLVFRTNDGRTEFYNTENGMPNNVIHALAEDSEGNVWASTNKGLVRFMHDTHTFRVYDTTDNMEVNEYCDGAAFANGTTVYFGGINGLSIIYHDASQPVKQRNVRFEFTGLSIMGTPVNIYKYLTTDEGERTLTLKYNQNTFQLYATNFDFLTPGSHHFYYSFSEEGPWIYNGPSSYFNLTQLSIGHHTLYIKYLNTQTGKESSVQQLDIIITPPWYLSLWAILAYVLLIAAMVYMAYRRWHRHRQVRAEILRIRQEQSLHDELYQQKMHFLTNLVHELNTPITLIYGPCERLLSYTGDSFVRKYTRIIMDNIGRLNLLIKEIIDLRRLSSNYDEIRIRSVAVGEWTYDIFGSFSEMANDNKITYEEEIDKTLVWNLDERYLTRIVSNLISNAFKYSHKGATIQVKLKRNENNELQFSVYNTGKGIAEKDRQRIFDYYQVLDNVDESNKVGLTSRNGLGMAICHNAVKRLGGNIEIDSKEGEYACFIVTLQWNELPERAEIKPLMPAYATKNAIEQEKLPEISATPNDSEPQESIEKTEIPSNSSLRKKREPHAHREGVATILVIDDNEEILTIVEDVLHDNYNVLTAQRAEQGLEVLKQVMPDLIVTDIMMPGMNGLELTHQLKANKHTMHIPLIILSAKHTDEEQVEGLESGADAYVSKPFSTQYLQATIARLLENQKVLREYYNTSASAYIYQNGKLMTSEERQFRDEVVEVIKKNLTNADFLPEDLARELNISQRNLYRKFNEAGLTTPKEYIKSYKIEYAARQLDTTNMTISEIIYASGFNTRSQFYAEFRKHYGVTPKEYREQRRIRDDSLES